MAKNTQTTKTKTTKPARDGAAEAAERKAYGRPESHRPSNPDLAEDYPGQRIDGPEPATREETNGLRRLEFVKMNPKGTVAFYRVPGVLGSVRIARRLFVGEVPKVLGVDGPLVAPDLAKASKARESADERAAKLQARIERAQTATAKNAAKLARLRAQIA